MRLLLKTSAAILMAAALGACSLGGMLGGGKSPTDLVTLTPEAAEPPQIARTAAAGSSVGSVADRKPHHRLRGT